MRAFCTVSAPLEVCASPAEQLSPGSRFLALRLLGNHQPKTLYFLVDAKSRVREVYAQTCLHFATQGMLDAELFGLAVLIDGEYMFADPESKLSKYGPKSWRSSHTHGLDANGRPLLELHFRVQFYIESPLMLKDETSRHNYYLQLKYNALQRDIPREYADQSMIMLAALALQADLGDAPAITKISTTTDANTKHSLEQQQQHQETTTDLVSSTNFKLGTNLTTTLPKISKRTASNNERMLRLSTYVATSTSHQPASKQNSASSSSKEAASLSTASSSSSLNQTAKTANGVDYFRLDEYLPVGMRNEWSANALRGCHREHKGLSAADAELQYIQQAAMVHESINAHNFRMRLSKSEAGPGNSCFVVYAKGIKIYGNLTADATPQKHQQQVATFLWPNITKLSFERKKFEIRTDDSKITLYANSDEKNKMLLTLCRETHQFSMKLAARLKDVLLKREQQAQLVDEDANCLHACYAYSRSLHLPPYKSKNDQRISVISSTSSNTTSGIVSDRVHSEDELEIMINTPPAPIAAPSTESLALAHLLDRPSVSRQTSSVGQVSLKELEEQLVALSVRQAKQPALPAMESENNVSPIGFKRISAGGNSSSSGSGSMAINNSSQRNATDSSATTDSPQSQHNIGSQCSSTCSTVVVATSSTGAAESLALPGLSTRTAPQRRNSTSSSLELGFSHTTQNSTLSEAESVSRAGEESESVSGMYTLGHEAPPTETSGVYTMHSSEMTGQSSEIAESEKNSHYGLFQSAKSEISDDHLLSELPQLDAVDGRNAKICNRLKTEEFRLRSDSNISTSGSFRGDGSDPTDNKHTLLTAKELTELIVGRGTYPNRKTVSRTLDSDCDYVTLPLTLAGDSYIAGHQDTAPTEEDQVQDLINDLLPIDPPAPPKRIDSNGLSDHASLSNIRMRSPPPYNGRHDTTGLCGPPVKNLQHTSIKKRKAATTASTAITSKLSPINVPSPSAKVVKENSKLSNSKSVPSMPSGVPSTSTTTTPTKSSSKVSLRRRDPPPYPLASKPRPTSLVSVASSTNVSSLNSTANVLSPVGGSMTSLKSEEVHARFITTRPQINILKAHTSLLNDNPKPSYAAPTNCSSAASSTGSLYSHNMPSHLSQHSVHNSNYISGSQASLNLSVQSSPAGAGIMPSGMSIPVVPYNLHTPHKSMSTLHQHRQHHSHHHQQPPPPPPPYPDLKQQQPTRTTCVLLPVIKPRQFLPPPPPSLPRQPPPPPPGVYAGSHLECKQLELYQQQMYSDVDYVIYPIQDPAVSQQEYLDAKQSSLLAAMAQAPPPHPYLAYHHSAATAAAAWDSFKGHTIYRSTPYLPLALSTHSRYASTQNLSDTYVQLPSAYSPIYSPSMASLCSSFEPPPPPPLHPAAFAVSTTAGSSSNFFTRSRSDDNILNTLDSLPKMKRLPPPPPPPYVNRRLKKPPMPVPLEQPPPIPCKPSNNLSFSGSVAATSSSPKYNAPPPRYSSNQMPSRRPPTLSGYRSSHMTKTSSGAHWAGERPKPDVGRGSSSILAQLQASVAASRQNAAAAALTATCAQKSSGTTSTTSAEDAAAKAFDISLLREKSKHLDLPLIAALCNDRSLLKQTKLMTPTTGNSKTSRNSLGAAVNSGTSATTTTANTVNIETNGGDLSKTTNGIAAPTTTAANMIITSTANNTSSKQCSTTNTTICKPARKNASISMSSNNAASIMSHRHPNDKLPPLPMQLAEANNYVMDPALLKHHKSYNSQT